MGLAVAADAGSISVKDGQRVEEAVIGALKVADGQRHVQLLCQSSEALQHWVALKGARQLKQLLLLVLAEIGRLEKLLQASTASSLTYSGELCLQIQTRKTVCRCCLAGAIGTLS